MLVLVRGVLAFGSLRGDLLLECVYLFRAGYQRQVALYAEAYRQHPDSRRLRRQVARARWMLAAADKDHPSPEALAELTVASAELRAVATFDADDADTPRLADYVDSDRAQMLARLGQFDAALTLIRADLAVEDQQWARHPAELQWLRDHIIDQGMLGEMLAASGRAPEGCAALATFRSEMKVLTQRGNIANMQLGDASGDAAAAEAEYCHKAVTRK